MNHEFREVLRERVLIGARGGVASGAGVGEFPCYVAESDPRLMRISDAPSSRSCAVDSSDTGMSTPLMRR